MKYVAMSQEVEVWKNIQDFDGMYQISNNGRVRSKKYGDWRLLKHYLCGTRKKQYCGVDLCKNGQYYKKLVHRLVAIHFIRNPKKLKEVNHKDGDKLNNCRYNLNWTDGVGNMKHARVVLGYNQNGEASSRAKLTEKDVRDIITKYKTGDYTYKEIAKDYNVASAHLCSIVRRRVWKHLKIA